MNTTKFENCFSNVPALSVSGASVVSIVVAIIIAIIIISIMESVIIIAPPGTA